MSMGNMKRMILVIDGQGGGVGRALTTRLREQLPQLHIRAVGANSTATEAMLKAGADEGATGENAVVVNAPKADFIAGPVAILMPNALLGEITPRMAEAVGGSEAVKVVVPSNRCGIRIAGEEQPLRRYLDSCVQIIREELEREDAV